MQTHKPGSLSPKRLTPIRKLMFSKHKDEERLTAWVGGFRVEGKASKVASIQAVFLRRVSHIMSALRGIAKNKTI